MSPDRPIMSAAFSTGGLEDRFARYHDAQVVDFVVVAAEHHADDVLADVVDVVGGRVAIRNLPRAL